MVRWSVILLSGEPGIGKSTIALQLSNWISESIVYVSGEETDHQLMDRANRLWIAWDNVSILAESNLEDILETISSQKSDIVIIDSISVINSMNSNWVSGSISQVKHCTEKLVEYAKTQNVTLIIIGHITKDGNLAWPKTLEHMVDTVLFFEWDKYEDIRFIRCLKNRFWATSEIAIFKMWEDGLKDLKNPGLEFVSSNQATIGSSLSITIEWTRPIVIETECLTTYTKFGYPKRSSRGINNSKLDMIIAVLWKYSPIKLESYDVYSNISRGFKIEEPWIDLSIAASIISSKLNKALDKKTIYVWEISLTWNIKNVMHLEKRIKEAEKLWFERIIVPQTQKKISSKNIEVITITSIKWLTDII
jgi:DNA repair protein RadA/Sms